MPPSPACSPINCVVFYSIDRDAKALNIVDKTTAATVNTIPLSISLPHAFGPNGPGFNGLATDPTTGALYGIARLSGPDIVDGNENRSLVTINPVTGQVTFVGSMGGAFSSIVFDAAGRLYGSTGTGDTLLRADALYTVDKGTGVATYVMDLYLDPSVDNNGDPRGRAHNLAFNTDTGFLYHLTFNRFSQIDLVLLTEIPVIVPQNNLRHHRASSGIVYDAVDDLFLTPAGGPDNELWTLTLTSATTADRRFVDYMGHKTKGLAFAGCPDMSVVGRP